MTAIRDPQQALDALDLANQIRIARCALKRRVRAGEVTASSVLMSPPEEAKTMSILVLLQSQHRWGRSRALRLLRRATLPETKRIGEMTERQRVALAQYLDGDSYDPKAWWS